MFIRRSLALMAALYLAGPLPAQAQEPKKEGLREVVVARKIVFAKGLPLVPIEKGELYELRVSNSANHEIAVSLALDGIDELAFSDDRNPDGTPRFSHWIVGAKGEVLIRGWHKTARDLTETATALWRTCSPTWSRCERSCRSGKPACVT